MQTSLAVSADGDHWVLVDASPDLRQQLTATPALHPRGLRHNPITDVVVTGAEIDRIAGLLTLREGHAFTLHAPSAVLDALARNPIFDALPPYRVPRRVLDVGVSTTVCGLTFQSFHVPGKAPLWDEGRPGSPEDNIGLRITDGRDVLFYLPSVGNLDAALQDRVRGASLVLHDATLWSDDELVRAGLSNKTSRRMGHQPLTGEGGSLAVLAGLGIERLVLVHINNSNPILIAGSPEAEAVAALGFEIGVDGQELFGG